VLPKDGKWRNLIAMLNNDMIGNSLSSGTMLRDNTKVRVLVKPSLLETEAESKMRNQLIVDNDSPSDN
jgi:hypothetical protein